MKDSGQWLKGNLVTSSDGAPDLDAIPAWKNQSVERSLKSARARAQDRSDRFVRAGIELIRGTGDTGFTVQEVVDQSGMSIRTFYLFFATKDDLLLAIHETILANEVEPRLRKRCDTEPDPVAKLQVYIEALFELTGSAAPVTRAFMVQQHRLAEARPNDLDDAMMPQVNLVEELLRDAADAGRLREGLDVERSAQLVHQLVLGVIEARVLGSKKMGFLTPKQVWEFCSSAIGAVEKSKSSARRSARRT
jgi:AcrR family transcriptional regulator